MLACRSGSGACVLPAEPRISQVKNHWDLGITHHPQVACSASPEGGSSEGSQGRERKPSAVVARHVGGMSGSGDGEGCGAGGTPGISPSPLRWANSCFHCGLSQPPDLKYKIAPGMLFS